LNSLYDSSEGRNLAIRMIEQKIIGNSKLLKKEKEEKRKQRLIKKGIVNKSNPFRYIEDVHLSQAINYDSSLYLTTEENISNKVETFRYSNNQRKFETKTKQYKNLRQKHKYDNPHIRKIENEISAYHHKTMKIDLFKAYLEKKLLNMKVLDNFYNHDKINYRKLRFNTYRNTQKSEAKMINQFRLKFGEPDQVIIIFGDGCQHHIKYKAPVKNKSMRAIFRRYGSQVYLIDEFRTSMLCYYCCSELHMVGDVDSPRPWRNKEEYIENTCSTHGIFKLNDIKCCNKAHLGSKIHEKNTINCKCINHGKLKHSLIKCCASASCPLVAGSIRISFPP